MFDLLLYQATSIYILSVGISLVLMCPINWLPSNAVIHFLTHSLLLEWLSTQYNIVKGY